MLSVAMATYNGSKHIQQQLESIARQDCLPDELVVSDDNSHDDTADRVHEFSKSSPFPVKFVHNQGPKGFRSNFENALRNTEGGIVLLADQDDIWLPGHVSFLAEPMLDDPSLLVTAGNSAVMDEKGTDKGYSIRDSEGLSLGLLRSTNQASGARGGQFSRVLRHRAVTGHSMALRRELLDVVTPFPQTWIHDQWIFVMAAAFGRVRYVQETVSRYRQHSLQVTGVELKSNASWLMQPPSNDGGQVESEIDRWQDLLQRLEEGNRGCPFPGQVVERAREKVRFIEHRRAVRLRARPARALPVASWLLRGKYHALGRGFSACARDLLT